MLPEPAAREVVGPNELQDHIAYQVFARLVHSNNITQFALIVKHDNTVTDVTICQ